MITITQLNPNIFIRNTSTSPFQIYKVTGVHLGRIHSQDYVTLKSLVKDIGYAHGKKVEESIVPLELLLNNDSLEIL